MFCCSFNFIGCYFKGLRPTHSQTSCSKAQGYISRQQRYNIMPHYYFGFQYYKQWQSYSVGPTIRQFNLSLLCQCHLFRCILQHCSVENDCSFAHIVRSPVHNCNSLLIAGEYVPITGATGCVQLFVPQLKLRNVLHLHCSFISEARCCMPLVWLKKRLNFRGLNPINMPLRLTDHSTRKYLKQTRSK